jgi:tetratricopeptide (TPR) repeat protein
MELNIEDLTELLEINDPGIIDLKGSIIKSFGDARKMRLMIDRQCENREQTHCYSCGNEAGCLILNGIIYLALGETEIAIKEVENANQHFCNEDKSWNHIIGLSLLGNAYEESKKDHRAFREYKKAHEILTNNYLRLYANDYIENAILLEKKLQDKLDELDPHSPKKNTPQPAKARLALPWMPTYTKLQESPNGPIWIEDLPQGKSAIVAKIILNESPHNVYSLKQDANLITLIKDRKYGWAKMSGDSMNRAKPLPILENDFVLFYKSDTADDNAIVIAAYSDNTGIDYQYVVRRYSQSIQSLVSETEPPNKYNPMPIIDEVRIIGVVIAVAKASN